MHLPGPWVFPALCTWCLTAISLPTHVGERLHSRSKGARGVEAFALLLHTRILTRTRARGRMLLPENLHA